MQIVFLGTRANIRIRNKDHYRHAVALVSTPHASILIDCGQDWLNHVFNQSIDAILITHAHNDHAAGLQNGTPHIVCATEQSLTIMKRYNVQNCYVVEPQKKFFVGDIACEAFTVQHSLHAPAVGYRLSVGNKALFYVPDLVCIDDQEEALHGINLYIGDGAIIDRNLLIRHKNGNLTGHSPICAQLAWCSKAGIKKAIFTHCGTEIVTLGDTAASEKIAALSGYYDIEVQIAQDGMRCVL